MKNIFKSVKKKQLLFFFILGVAALIYTSCKDVINYKEDYFLVFYPQKCEMVRLEPYKWFGVRSNKGEMVYGDMPMYGSDNKVSWDSLMLHVTSTNLSKGEFLDDSIPGLQEEIRIDYEKQHSLNSSKSSVSISNEPKTAAIDINYCINGLKNMNITAIDEPLYGSDKTMSLNDYAEIRYYYPDFVASFDTKSLIYGFGDNDKPNTIVGLLALNPLVPFQVVLEFKVKPDNLPVSTRFRIELENSEGKLMADTTEMLDILE